jgi:VCBS repeat-containing protein
VVTGLVTATDVDGDPLTYTLVAPVAGLTLNTDGSYSFDPSNDAYQSLAAGVTTNVVATYSVADGQGGSSTSTLTITVTGTNDAATIAGTATGTVTEDGALTASGILTVSDIDTGEEIFADVDAAALNTDYGTFTFDSATGAWGFILDNDAAQSLAGGQAVTLSLNVSSGDGTANETINVTINGTNDAATISGDMTGSVTEDGALTASGILTVSDIDTGEEIFADVDAAALNTDYGTFTFDSATGGWNFTLDNDAAQSLGANDGVTRSLTVSSIDATASETIVVTINGSNDAATISGDVLGSVTEDGTLDASGTLTVADIDTGENVFAEIDEDDLSTDYGTFTFNSTTGAWKFTLDEVAAQSLGANDVVTRSLTVSSIDGTANQTIVVTINGTNDAATISGDTTGSVTEDGALIASGTLTVADIDTGESVFAEVDENDLSTDYGKFEFNRTTGEWKFTLDNDAAQSLGANDVVTRSLTVSSIDGTASQKINVTITGTNDAATISGDTTGSVTEDGALTASGTLTVADADAGQAAFAPVDAIALTTDYGTFTFDSATGAWGFTLDNDAAQSLAGGEAVTRSLIVLSVDSTATEAIAVTINGTNDAPVFGQANYAFAINENATGVVGSVIATDADVTDALTYSLVSNPAGLFSINGQTGAISLNTPRDFETHAQSYELMVVATDPALATATTTVRVSIQDVVEDSTHDGTSGDDIIDKSGSLNNWTINGLAGNDVITGGLGNDIINGGLGNDTIRGGAGDDRIVLTADGRDTVIFEATASGNGFDTIVDFTAGNTGDSADVLKFDHIIGGVDAASGGVFSGPKVSVFNSTSNYNDNVTGKVVLFDASAADANIIAAEFGPNQSFALNANGKAVVMTGSSGSQKVSIWYVENGSESNGVQANEIFLVGTMSLSVGDIFSFHASNFSFA